MEQEPTQGNQELVPADDNETPIQVPVILRRTGETREIGRVEADGGGEWVVKGTTFTIEPAPRDISTKKHKRLNSGK